MFPYKYKNYLFSFFEKNATGILIAQLVKNPPAMQEMLVPFLSQEDLLKKR